jgi:helix-turn-helix protein
MNLNFFEKKMEKLDNLGEISEKSLVFLESGGKSLALSEKADM